MAADHFRNADFAILIQKTTFGEQQPGPLREYSDSINTG